MSAEQQYTVTKREGEEHRVAYDLHGPRGAHYGLVRNQHHPEQLFAINLRTFGVVDRLGWFTDQDGDAARDAPMTPGRQSILGALSALLVAENGGDIADEVFIICDALGIERPEYDEDEEHYRFSWQAEES